MARYSLLKKLEMMMVVLILAAALGVATTLLLSWVGVDVHWPYPTR
ncbi:hypothetical protein [Pantoea sp. 1.19]|nr:hypothetical protein [Pantoea sp. 1.19]